MAYSVKKNGKLWVQKFPFHFQLAANDCAPACVLAISEFYGLPTTIGDLRRKLVTSPRHGTSLRNFSDGLHDQFHVEIGKQPVNRLDSSLLPFIAFFPRQGHFVVVWNVSRSSAVIGDPGIGLISVPFSTFFQNWDGTTVVLRPDKDLPREVGRQHRVRDSAILWRFFRRQFVGMLFVSLPAMILGILNALFSIVLPYYVIHVHKLLWTTAIFIALSVGLSSITNFAFARQQRELEQKLGQPITTILHKLDLNFYTMGDVYTRFQDVQELVKVVLNLARDLPYTVVIWAGTVAYLALTNSLLTEVILGMMVLLLGVLTPFVKRVRNYVYRVRLRSARVSNELLKFWDGTTTNRVHQAWTDLVTSVYGQAIWRIPIAVVVSNTPVLGILVIAILISLTPRQTPHVSVLLSTIFLVNYVTGASHNLYQKYVAWQEARPSLYRLSDFMEGDG